MPTLTIKGMPDPVYRRLKQQAAAHGRSLNREIIACLERSLEPAPVDPDVMIARVRELRKRLGIRPMSSAEIRAAIREGRE